MILVSIKFVERIFTNMYGVSICCSWRIKKDEMVGDEVREEAGVVSQSTL